MKNYFLLLIFIFSFKAQAQTEFESLFVCDVVGNPNILVEIFYSKEGKLVKLKDTEDKVLYINLKSNITSRVKINDHIFRATSKSGKLFAYFSRTLEINKKTHTGYFKLIAKGLKIGTPFDGFPVWLGKKKEVEFENCY